MATYTLRDIRICTPRQRRAILDVRNQSDIRSSMVTGHIISEAEHRTYLAALEGCTRRRVFLVIDDGGNVAGSVGLSAIDREARTCQWAFFIDSKLRGGVGSALEAFMLDYVLLDMGMERLDCEVLESNPRVLAMHERFGFIRDADRDRMVQKDGCKIWLLALSLRAARWCDLRDQIRAQLEPRLGSIVIRLEETMA